MGLSSQQVSSLKKPQKILILAAIPYGLRLDKEIREIEEAIRRATHRDLFEIKVRTAVRPQDIRRAIAEEQPQIVHFCGHGENDGSLLLEDDGGNNKLVAPEGLASLFKLHADYVNCVLLNACHSEPTAKAISQYINYAIGMNQPIDDKAAIAFAQGFYDGLGYTNSVNSDLFQRAFDEGMVAIQLENLSQGSIPVLKKKLIQITSNFQVENHVSALDVYRQEVEEILHVNQGIISHLNRRILDVRRENLGIPPQDANAIEVDAQSPYIKRRQKLQGYVEALVETLHDENIVTDVTRNLLKRYQQVLELSDEDIKLIPSILANVLYNQGKLDQSLAAYQEAIQINPEDEVARQNLGNILIICGYIEEAIIEYQAALRLNPYNVQILTILGSIFYNQNKFDEAISEYRKALDIEKNNAEIRVNLAFILSTQDKLDEAISEYREALCISPNFADAYAGLGRALCGKNCFMEAGEMLQKAISIDSENSTLYRDLGSVFYKQGNLEKAIAMFKQAIKLDPHEAIAYTNLGAALYERGQRQEARETLEQASRFLKEQNMLIEANQIDEALKQKVLDHKNWLSLAKKIFLW